MVKKVLSLKIRSEWIALAISLIFFLNYISATFNRHLSFQSHAFDLGIYTQITYLYSQNLTPYSSLKHMILLADHFGLILIPLSLFYKIWSTPLTLLTLQALFVSLAGFLIYLIAQDKLKNFWITLLVLVAFYSSSGIISAINFDFHLTTISVLPLSLILYSWHFRKWRLYWFSLFIAVLFKEDIPIFILGLGIYQLITKQIRIGFYTILFSIVSYFLIKFQIMPFLWPNTENAYLATSVLPLSSPFDFLYIAMTNPAMIYQHLFNSQIKITTFDTLFRPCGFFSIFSLLSYLTVIPYLLLRFSSGYTQMWTLQFHHNANLVPFLAVSAIYGISNLKLKHFFVLLIFLFFLITSGFSFSSLFWPSLNTSINNKLYLKSALFKLPRDVALSAQSPLVPHLANREKIYLFPEIYDAEFIVLDTSLSGYPLTDKELKSKIVVLKKSRQWRVYYQSNTLIIFQKI